MATVRIEPLSGDWRDYARRWLPRPRFVLPPRPIFTGGEPTAADRALALELWRALDPLSRRWYTGFDSEAREFAGLPLTEADRASLLDE